jgi:hypothetical protein
MGEEHTVVREVGQEQREVNSGDIATEMTLSLSPSWRSNNRGRAPN